MPHVNPTTPKIGQWNTTLSQTRRNKFLKNTYNYINIYTHTETNTCIGINSNNLSLPVAPVPRRSSATRVQHYHTHLPAAQTRSLDWNDRIKKKKKTPLQPKPPLHRMPPRIYANKNFYSWNPGAISCNRRTSGKKAAPAVVFYSILQTCSDKTHTVNKKMKANL